MKILFLHNNFPAQFRHVAAAFAKAGHEAVFLSAYRKNEEIEGVKHMLISRPNPKITEDAVANVYLERLDYGRIAADSMLKLRGEGFVPDIVYSHPGWGCAHYVPDIFPKALNAGYFEWYYGTDACKGYFAPPEPDRVFSSDAENRQRNMCILDALQSCHVGICPTQWQKSRHPKEYLHKLHVMHDGIDVEFFSPRPTTLHLPDNTELKSGDEVLTYATRGLEPYRGFPAFYTALPRILEERPDCHVIIMADDRVCYGTPRSDGKTWKTYMRETVPLPEQADRRVHFLPFSSYNEYRGVLRVSAVHVYLTVPFVLSWSLTEAMSCGCLLVASDTETVREAIQHGREGILTDMRNTDRLAGDIIEALSRRAELVHMRQNARRTAVERFALHRLLPRHMALLTGARRMLDSEQ